MRLYSYNGLLAITPMPFILFFIYLFFTTESFKFSFLTVLFGIGVAIYLPWALLVLSKQGIRTEEIALHGDTLIFKRHIRIELYRISTVSFKQLSGIFTVNFRDGGRMNFHLGNFTTSSGLKNFFVLLRKNKIKVA
jgi:hypothetical protein